MSNVEFQNYNADAAATVIACDMTVFTDEQRESHLADAVKLFAKVQEVVDMPDGFALSLPDENGILLLLARFIRDERLCCPFIHFGLEVEANRGAIWFKLSGKDGIKPFIAAEMMDYIPDDVKNASNASLNA